MGKSGKTVKGLSKEEIAAMKEYLKEKNSKGNGEKDVLAAITKMKEPDRTIGKRVHALVMSAAPNLMPKTWYGMPAYAMGDKVVCYFQNAGKFKARYQLLGFSDKAKLDEGNMWPVVFALTKLTSIEEKKIIALVKRALD
ncbi:MAG: DUF1801 domain-containing protein [Candidatus Micrarchaeota archaeon]|nr:DUF1801 domain-containing protein [Candidatus Micrarchaeota archaeon]